MIRVIIELNGPSDVDEALLYHHLKNPSKKYVAKKSREWAYRYGKNFRVAKLRLSFSRDWKTALDPNRSCKNTEDLVKDDSTLEAT